MPGEVVQVAAEGRAFRHRAEGVSAGHSGQTDFRIIAHLRAMVSSVSCRPRWPEGLVAGNMLNPSAARCSNTLTMVLAISLGVPTTIRWQSQAAHVSGMFSRTKRLPPSSPIFTPASPRSATSWCAVGSKLIRQTTPCCRFDTGADSVIYAQTTGLDRGKGQRSCSMPFGESSMPCAVSGTGQLGPAFLSARGKRL